MEEEFYALDEIHAWDLVILPPRKTTVSWIHKIKTKFNRSIDRYETRLVDRGFTQEYVNNYEKTFLPVILLTFVRSLLAIGASKHRDT